MLQHLCTVVCGSLSSIKSHSDMEEDLNDPDVVIETYAEEEVVNTLAFGVDHDVNPALFDTDDEDIDRQAYTDGGFQGNSSTKWAHEKKVFVRRVEFNGASDELLQSVKAYIPPTLLKCHELAGVANGVPMKRSDFARIYFNRDVYQLFQNYIYDRVVDKSSSASADEIKEIIRVWILQFIYKTTSTSIYNDTEWYGKGKLLHLSESRYDYLVGTLGAGLPKLDVYLHNDDEEVNASHLWGQFNQNNLAILKMEQLLEKLAGSL